MISTKGRYALRVMIEMATHDREEFVPLKTIADNQDISGKYLEAIISPLVKAGLLDGQRGKGGGDRLSKAPEEYTVLDILREVETSIAPVACLEGPVNTCERAPFCSTLEMWTGLRDVMFEYLDGVTLLDLAKKEEAKPTLKGVL